MMISQKGAKWK